MKLTTIMVFFLSASVLAQERTVASGNEATGVGGTVSYSIGLIDYTSSTGSGGSMSEGVQQSYIISGVGIEEWNLSYDVSVYPNPAIDYFVVNMSEFVEGVEYTLTDEFGKSILNGTLASKETEVSIASFARATFYFTLQKSGKMIRTYSIIKTN